jgi:hypothetical protein
MFRSRFPVLGGDFQSSESGFPVLGNGSQSSGSGFLVLGYDFQSSGSGLPIPGNVPITSFGKALNFKTQHHVYGILLNKGCALRSYFFKHQGVTFAFAIWEEIKEGVISDIKLLHTPSILPPHLKQRMSDLPQRAILHRFHQLGKEVFVIHGCLLQALKRSRAFIGMARFKSVERTYLELSGIPFHHSWSG